MGYTIADAGWVITCFGLGAVCGGLLGGWVSDKVGFYYVQIVALVAGGCMFFVLEQARTLTGICTCAFALAFINDSFRPANAASIGHYSKEGTATRSFSLNRLAINMGWALGGSMGGLLAAHSYEWLFRIDGITNLLAAFFLWLFLSPKKVRKNLGNQHVTEEVVGNTSPYKDRAYLWFIFFTILFAMCFFQLFSTLPVYYRVGLQLSEVQIGLLMGLNGLLIGLFEMIIVKYLEGKRSISYWMFMGTVFMAMSFLVFNLLPGALLVALVSVAIITVGEMMAMPFMNTYWVSRTNPYNRGKYAGLFTMAWAIAQVAGPAGGAQIAHRWGYDWLWWLVGGLCLLSALGYLMLRRTT